LLMSDSLGLRDFHNVPHLDRTCIAPDGKSR
jgi:hypothetical protein